MPWPCTADGHGRFTAQVDGRPERLHAVAHGDGVYVQWRGRAWRIDRLDPTRASAAAGGDAAGLSMAPMPGVVVSWQAAAGQRVKRRRCAAGDREHEAADDHHRLLRRHAWPSCRWRGADLPAQRGAGPCGCGRGHSMSRLVSHLDTTSAAYRHNHAEMTRRVQDLRAMTHKVRHERPQRDVERLHRQKKLTVRERLDLLLDPGTPFLELSTLAANRAYGGEVHGAGCVSGIGIVQGREVIIHADDPSIKGGAWYPLTIKKIVRTLDIAIENRLPVIHLCDSAGGFLPLQSELFPDRYAAGRIFRNQCTLSKMGVPQIAVVLGHCTAGGAYIPALCDYSVIVRGNGGVFLGGPPLVKAATGEVVTAEALGGADMHTSISGTCDYPADDEPHAFAIARDILAQTTPIEKTRIDRVDAEPRTTTRPSCTASFPPTGRPASRCAR
jgi:acetyl-CoA carboxylase beta subunit